jgi:hypothetical protein
MGDALKKVTLAAILLLPILLAACGDGGQGTLPAATQGGASPTAAGKFARAVIANSELVKGENRFVLGLLDTQSGQPINYVPEVSVQFFKVNADETALKVGDGTVIYHSENLPAGVYVSRFNFTDAGPWGAVVTVKPQGESAYQQRLDFTVLEDSSVPRKGEPAPPSKQDLVGGPGIAAIGEICSAVPHDDMHSITIADAVTSGKPTALLFAAPGFCPSFTCGPDLELMGRLKEKYGDKVNFIHVEAPNEIQNHTHTGPVDPNHSQEEGHRGVSKPQVETAREWGLKSEPWLFLVDEKGIIAEGFEGGLTMDEVEPELVKLVQ